MKNSERNPLHLFEIFNPGQYFEIDIYSNGIIIWCMLMRSRGSAKYRYPGPYSSPFIPFNKPYRIYEFFNNLKFGTLYKEIEI